MKFVKTIYLVFMCFYMCYCSSATGKEITYYKCMVDGKRVFSDEPCSANLEKDKRHIDVPLSPSERWEKKYAEKKAKELQKLNDMSKKSDEDKLKIDIALRSVVIGLSKEDFLNLFEGLRIGSIKTNKTKSALGIREQVVLTPYWYSESRRKFYYFRDGVLTTIQD